MQSFQILKNDSEQRLDSFLKKLFPQASLSFIFKSIRTGKIKVITLDEQKTKQKPEYKLSTGETVNVYLGETEIQSLRENIKDNVVVSQDKKLHKKDIIFEDEYLLILNKNPGINVHPGDHKSEEVSLIEQVQDYYAQKLDSLTFSPSLAHRIDRDTSGVIVIAKQKQALVQIVQDFKEKNALKKMYFTVVIGKLSHQSGTIKKSLARREKAHNENKIHISESGQEAITHYKVLDEYILQLPEGEVTLSAVEVQIETGRMHQIRVHMAHIGNPILGDKTYGDKKLNSYFEKNYYIQRQMLHAWKLELMHPIKKKALKIQAPLKADMQKFIDSIKK
ncbi:RluA family pseudouridine synthase [Candidatus Gracilibacteria bacterium]|nr:RluA family pseudouridine synthase [Candidatus Gracilibacteria bacterium]